MPTIQIPVNKKSGSIAGGIAAMIITALFAVEGGYVDNPKDPGGETNHGITKTVAVANGYTGPMKSLTTDLATSIYYKDYIVKPGFVPFLDLSPAVTQELVDSAVNTGPSHPSIWLQKALNSLSRDGKDFPPTLVDGKVGPGTVNAYRALQRIRGKVLACELVIKLLDSQQATYYMSLDKLSDFTVGWITNRIGNVPLSRCKDDGESQNAAT